MEDFYSDIMNTYGEYGDEEYSAMLEEGSVNYEVWHQSLSDELDSTIRGLVR